MKEVLLVGLGAVGAVYALVLKKSGAARVTVVARSNYEIVKSEGIHFKSQRYGDVAGWRPDRLCRSVEEASDQVYSHVLVTTKTVPEVQTTPQLLAPLLSPPYTDKFPVPVFVLLQNGLNIHLELFQTLKKLRPFEDPKIISGSLWIGTRLAAKNVVEHSYFDRVHLGVCRSTPNILFNTEEETATLNEIGDMMKAGGSDIIIVPEIQRVKFEKNIVNCVISPSTSLPRYPMQTVFRPPQVTVESPELPPTTPYANVYDVFIPASYPIIAENTIPFLHDAFAEVAAVGNALFPPTAEGPVFGKKTALNVLKSIADIASKATSTERLSMHVDVEMGRPTELEVIVGEVVHAGRKLGVSTPRLETLYALMAVVQTQLLRARENHK
ncbi:unnamed protein product [Somion occarium]|uniref:2-dehydropantoate 2-reductase n=1 Tax=Somion occarium TaxID=3059160 RepID=A0ABP1DP54_9APHY